MSLRGFVLTMLFGSLVSWAAWLVVLLGVNPQEAGVVAIAIFYMTLAVALTGTAALLLSFIRLRLLGHHHVPSRAVKIAFRHAVFFSAIAVVSLVLSQNGLFHPWHVVALVAAASIAEFLFTQAQDK
jgi:hypothetical protein